MDVNAECRVGSCTWTAPGWDKAFYPKGLKKNEYIGYYATQFDTVEIDCTFYAVPPRQTVEHWRAQVPRGFVFTAKFPQHITHEKLLTDCFADAIHFLETMAHLGDNLGPLLLQFPYFAQGRGVTLQDFLDKLAPFLAALPKEEFQYAVEVRNKQWVCDPLLDLLHCEGVALTLIDHPWMYPPAHLMHIPRIVTAPFTYIRLLGDRKGIEQITKVFKETVVDRRADCDAWIPVIESSLSKSIKVYTLVNNHYGGYSPTEIDYIRQVLGLPPRQFKAGPPETGMLL